VNAVQGNGGEAEARSTEILIHVDDAKILMQRRRAPLLLVSIAMILF
jgi:hypothetical protein